MAVARAAAPARSGIARGTAPNSTGLEFSGERELGEARLKRIQVRGFGFRWQLNGIKSRQRVYDIVWRWTK